MKRSTAKAHSPRDRSAKGGAGPESPEARAPEMPGPAAKVLWTVLVLCLLLRVAAAFANSNWLWGLDAFGHWPPAWGTALALLPAIGLLPPAARTIAKWLERCGTVWERGGVAADLLVGAALAIIMFSLRDPIRFTGDADLRLNSLSAAMRVRTLFPQASPLDVTFNFYLPRWLMSQGLPAQTALQFVGAMVGGLFTFASLGFLRAAGARGPALVTGAAVILSGGYLAHFAGYDKFGPLLLGLALAGWGAASLARAGTGEWLLAAGAIVCVLSHRSGLLVAPSVLWTFAAAWRAAKPGRRTRVAVAGTAFSAVTLALLPHLARVFVSIDWAVHLPGGAVARSLQTSEAPAALMRLSDALNALFLLVPLWPAGIAAWWLNRPSAAWPPGRKGVRFSPAMSAILALGAYALVLFGIGTSRGSGRDWDASAAMGVVTALVSAYALASAGRFRLPPRVAALVVTLALPIAVATWGMQADETIAMHRIHGLLRAHPAWSSAARAQVFDLLGWRALRAERLADASREWGQAIAYAPNPRFFHQRGLAELGMGRLDSASALFRRAAQLSPHVADPWVGLARTALAGRDTLYALAALDSALSRNPAEPSGLALRSAIAERRPGATPRP